MAGDHNTSVKLRLHGDKAEGLVPTGWNDDDVGVAVQGIGIFHEPGYGHVFLEVQLCY